MRVRTRYAPSPTGYLHIGNARTALFAFLFAKHHSGDFVVRIEDTDTARNIEDGERSQFENLNWLGIIHDESVDTLKAKYGPYRQLERLEIYADYAEKLLSEKKAYKCYCTEDDILKARDAAIAKGKAYLHNCDCWNKNFDLPYSIRVKSPENINYVWDDMVRGRTSFSSEDVGDYVIIKNNGIPTYNFAVAIDDHLMEITHVLRGEEHISNTPKQMMIYNMFSWEYPKFGHMSLIMNETGKKLSKRDSHIIQFISQYKDLGYLPEAIVNFIALLGWSPKGNQEIMNMNELIEQFDSQRLSKSPAIFNVEKLNWINSEYIKKLPDDEYINIAKEFIKKEYDLVHFTDEYINEVILLYKSQLKFFIELIDLTKYFFGNEENELSPEAKKIIETKESQMVINLFNEKMSLKYDGQKATIKSIINEVKAETNFSGKQLFMPIRIALTSKMHGPDLVTTIYLTKYDNEK